jgi:hypothetical protein
MTEIISSYGDLAANPDLGGRDVDAVATLLLDHGHKDDWLIAWVPKWILEDADKDVDVANSARQVVHGRIDHETEKAYLLAQGRDDAWLPKSVIARFERAEDADIRIPQRGLAEFEEGEA